MNNALYKSGLGAQVKDYATRAENWRERTIEQVQKQLAEERRLKELYLQVPEGFIGLSPQEVLTHTEKYLSQKE